MAEYEFARIWKGVGKKIDMGKVMKHKTREKQLTEFKKQISKLSGEAKNLKYMKTGNLKELYFTAIANKEAFLLKKEAMIADKKLLSAADRKHLADLENLRRIKKGLTEAKQKQVKQEARQVQREELVTTGLKKRKVKIDKRLPERKKSHLN